MDYITACAIVKDEDAYLAEWIAYHRLLGVTRFIFYDNGSRVPLSETVAPFAARKDITVIPFEGNGVQSEAYTDCISKVTGKTIWLSLTDIDEFLVPVKAKTLIEVLQPYEAHGALGVNWQTFGSAGHKVRPSGLQIDNFTLRTAEQWNWNRHIKSIVRPERTIRAMSPHQCEYRKPYVCVNEKSVPVDGAFSTPVSREIIQVNHYFTRSKKEYEEKVARGAADGTHKPLEYFDLIDRKATQRDLLVTRFSENLKYCLKNLGLSRDPVKTA